MKKTLKTYFFDAVFYTAGTVIYSVAILMFISPANISPGGFTGVALVFHHLLKLPTGLTLLLLNIPVFLIAFKKFGATFIIRTAVVTVMVSVALDVGERFVSPFRGDIILNAVFGGILVGLGLGIVLLRGGTTGGVDIIGKLINSRRPHISIGRVILIGDALVLLLNALCYRDFSGALYSVITIYITSVVLDGVLYGADKGKLIYVITENGKNISKKILLEVGRGVTEITASGAYTEDKKDVLMCAVRRNEVAAVFRIIKKEDKNAFVIVCEAGEVTGRGFKE